MSGFSNVSEYQVSSMPWLTSSTITGIKLHRFPWVTQYFILKNDGAARICVYFTETGLTTNNYFPVDTSGSLSLSTRVSELYLSGSAANPYSLFAGLTTIPTKDMPVLTSSNLPTNSAILHAYC